MVKTLIIVTPTKDTEPEETPEQILRKTNPAGAELIDYVNERFGNLEYYDWCVEEAAERYNEHCKDFGWYSLVWYSLKEEGGDVYQALRTRVAFRDNKFVTWEEQLMSDYHGAKIEIELGRYVIITSTDGKVLVGDEYTTNKAFKQVTLRSTYTKISRFEEKYKDITVERAVLLLLNSKPFKEAIKDPEFEVTEKELNSFYRDFDNAIELGRKLTTSEAPLVLALDEIINNYDYDNIFIAMSNEDEDLVNIIFDLW